MKTHKLIIAFIVILTMFGINCLSQEELKNPEKDEVVNRIKNDIQLYNEKWLPEVRKLLLNGDAGITKDELDSLLVILVPTFKIKENCLVKSDLMIVKTLEKFESDYLGENFYYNYIIVPDSSKYTLYSSISGIYNMSMIEGTGIKVINKKGKWKYSSMIPVGSEINTPLHISKIKPKYRTSQDYSDKFLLFYINSSKIDQKEQSTIRHYIPLKSDMCFIYNNRIYSSSCLKYKFLTNDLNEIFENNPCNICDCDIDVYFRINEKAEEVK